MTDERLIRDATPDDAAACAAVYAPYIANTAVTFETEPVSAADMAGRMAAAAAGHAWLVVEDAGRVVGYAYGSTWKTRAAYRWACEVSIYLEMGRRRRGDGRALYEALFERLVDRGFRIAVAGMTLPNEGSVGLHTALGFEPAGVNRAVGWKNDAWHDVAWMQKALVAGEDPPTEPR